MTEHTSSAFQVVIIDDNLGDLTLLQEALHFTGANVEMIAFTSALTALAFLKRSPPVHLIISDVNMPKVSGIQLLTLLLEDQNLCDIPVALTSSSKLELLPKSLCERLHVPYFVKANDWDGYVNTARQIHAALQAGRDPLAAQRLAEHMRTPVT